jgi:hypothetical protein
MSPRPGGDVSNSSEFATMGSGEYRASIERRRSASALALDIVRRHTGLVLILTYLTVTVVARMADVWFFRHFRINIFNYSDPEDFFTASMRNSSVWLYLLIPALLLLLVSWLMSRRSDAPSPQRPPFFDARWNTPGFRLALGVVIVVAAATFVTRMSADRRADRVHAGQGRRVTFDRSDGVTYNEQPLLIGTTGGFFFLYYVQRKVTEIVPVENTALMTVDLQQKNGQNSIPPAGGDTNAP